MELVVAGSVNKVILVGNLGADPEIRNMQSGDKVCNLSIATSESWKDKSGEKQERTQWHKVVVFNQNIVKVCESYLKKGAKVYVEGTLETRSWEQDGQKKYTTEVVLRPYRGELTMLDGKGGASSGGGSGAYGGSSFNDSGMDDYAAGAPKGASKARVDELEDEIPF
jgi:single-strand DNA-binding protein